MAGSSRSSSARSARALGAVADLERLLLADHLHGDLGQVAHDRLDVAADVADLGELRGLDLEERRVGQARQAPRDLGLADARRPDHEDVLRQDLARHLGRQALPAPAVAQRDRHGLLRALLADDVLVELRDDLARRARGGRRRLGLVLARHQENQSELLERDVVVGVDVDLRGDEERLARDVASPTCPAGASRARAPRPARRRRPSRSRGRPPRGRSGRPCRRSGASSGGRRR